MGVLRRKSLLFRRKSSRNVSAIEAQVDYIVERSPFLLEEETRAQHEEGNAAAAAAATPTFRRKEYQTGSLLGTGSFSKVHAIIGFKLSSNSSRKLSKEQRQLISSSTCSEGSSTHVAFEPRELSEHSRNKLTRSAFDSAGEARYAVKFVKKELTKNSGAFRNAAADLIVEAKYLSALDHPNILKVRGMASEGSAGFFDGHDGFFFIMDRLQETLVDRIQRWKEEPGRSNSVRLARQASYALQIADALAYLHDRRILFRDLKPSNVGFRAEDPSTVQLFDFGLCRELPASDDTYQDDEAFQMSGAGTYLYMAPEISTAKRYNLKADVFSWGLLFHEMMTLERPFAEFTYAEHKEFVCEIGQRPSLTDHGIIPASLQTLLRQAWEQDPTERITMRQVCQQLQPIVGELQPVPEAIPPPTHPEGWNGLGRTLVVNPV